MRILSIILLVITVIVLGLVAFKYTTNTQPDIIFWDTESKDEKKGKKKYKQDDGKAFNSNNIKVEAKYVLPAVLSEVSGISYINNQRFACVQDEDGIIFIFNVADNKIEKAIPFAGIGDYEGIALNGTTAYVVNSSGVIYEVENINAGKPKVREYQTTLNAKDDVEALCFDKANNRLLLAYKREEDNGNSKGIYTFDLTTKKLAGEPVFVINLDNALPGSQGKKAKLIKPSGIAIHPTNGDIYLIEGSNPRVLVLDNKGSFKTYSKLDNNDFEQPEGITFDTAGVLYISNEGKKGSGNILKVNMQ